MNSIEGIGEHAEKRRLAQQAGQGCILDHTRHIGDRTWIEYSNQHDMQDRHDDGENEP